jgi:hypothetical protein
VCLFSILPKFFFFDSCKQTTNQMPPKSKKEGTRANPIKYEKGKTVVAPGQYVKFNNGAVAKKEYNGRFTIVQGANEASLTRARSAPRRAKRPTGGRPGKKSVHGVGTHSGARARLIKRYSDLLKAYGQTRQTSALDMPQRRLRGKGTRKRTSGGRTRQLGHKSTRSLTYDLNHRGRVLSWDPKAKSDEKEEAQRRAANRRSSKKWNKDPHRWDLEGLDDGSMSKAEIRELVRKVVLSARKGGRKDLKLGSRRIKKGKKVGKLTSPKRKSPKRGKKKTGPRKKSTRPAQTGGRAEYFGNWF